MTNLQKIIRETAPQAYYVGGALRDGILKRYSGDIDLALPKELVRAGAKELAKKLKAAAFEMDAEFCVWRVTAKNGLQIDLCGFIGKDIQEDLKRRDFTINALAYPVSAPLTIRQKMVNGKRQILLCGFKKEHILDLNKGLSDIQAKIIRANGEKVFKEDPLRLLRAYRTAAELNFTIDKNTLKLIAANAALVKKPAGERLQEEIKRIFKQPKTRHWLEQLDKAGLLDALVPPLKEQKHCAEVYYGKGGVFEHTMLVVERLEFLLANLKIAFPKYHKRLEKYAQDISLYKMAALLHDIAKPATAKEVDGRLRFFYHEEKGAKMAEVLLKDLKYSSSQIWLICKMIEFHLRPSNLASNEIITDKGVYKFFKELGDAAIPMLLLCWADYTSYVTPTQMRRLMKQSSLPVMSIEEGKKKANLSKTLRHMQMLNFLFKKYFTENKTIVSPEKLLNGKEIIELLKIEPGPLVGKALELVTLAQVEGKVRNKEEAVKYLLSKRSIL